MDAHSDLSAPEVWTAVVGEEGRYEVSSHGRIRSLNRPLTFMRRGKIVSHIRSGKILRQKLELKTGYLRVQMGRDAPHRSVHRIVLEAFCGPCPRGHVCAHGDGDRTNNTPFNLRWATPSNNQADRRLHGTARLGRDGFGAKLTPSDAEAIRASHKTVKRRALAEKYGVSRTTIRAIQIGRAWA